MKNYYEDLHNLCVWNMPEQIIDVLNEHRSDPLDLTYDEGDLFKVATLNGNYKLLPITNFLLSRKLY